jgi:hypothetical protein
MTPAGRPSFLEEWPHTRALQNAPKGMDLTDQCAMQPKLGAEALAYNQATKTIAATSTAAIDQSAGSHFLVLDRTWSVSIVDIDTAPTSKRRSLILVRSSVQANKKRPPEGRVSLSIK